MIEPPLVELSSSNLTERGESRALRLVLVVICIITALVGRLCLWPIALRGDGYIFAYMGKLISEGGRFQHDLIDNKLPTVGLLMMVPWKMFGAWGPGYLLLQLVMAMVGARVLARTAGRHFGEENRRPTFLAAMLLLNFTFIVGGGFQLETVQSFFSILAASAAIEAMTLDDCRDAFVVGFCAGIAAMVKPSALAVLAAFAIAAFACFGRKPLRVISQGLAAAAGLAIPTAATLIYLIGADNLRDMPGLLRQIAAYASQSLWEPWDLAKPIIAIVVLGFPLLVRGWIFRRDRTATSINPAGVLFVIAWLFFEFAGVVLQRRMYAYHFMVLAAPAALMFGMIPRRDRTWPTAAALGPIVIFSLWSSWQIVDEIRHQQPTPDVAVYLRDHTHPGDYVWRDRVMSILLDSDLRSGSRLPMTFLFMNSDESPLVYGNIIVQDFKERRPVYIILPASLNQYTTFYSQHVRELAGFPQRQKNFVTAWGEIQSFVQSKYTAETQLGMETVYRRNDSPIDQARVN